jgi:uncharacterized protein (TIGR02271 family)
MTDTQTGTDWHGRTVVDRNGDKVGSVEQIYLDDLTGQPEWLLVKTGMFGTKSTFVPLQGARADDDETLTVAFEKEQIKDAPSIEADHELTEDEEQRIYSHYGMSYAAEGGLTSDTSAGRGYDTSGPTTDEAMTRSEEELRVGTQQVEAGRARLRKYVVTEQVQTTVPVSHEEVRVETEPITEGNVDQALDGPAISEEEHEVVLHEERPVVQKEAVPKERVRLKTDTVTEEAAISEEVRKEQIEAEGDQPAR